MQADYDPLYEYKIQNKLNRFFFTIYKKTYYIAVSKYVKRLFMKRYKLPKNKIRLIFDGISPEFVYNTKSMSFKSHKKIRFVGTVSRVAVDRGIKEFIETAYLTAKVFPQVKFIFAGMIEKDFYSSYPEWTNLVNSLNVKKNIEFRSRFINRKALKNYYKSLDIFFISAPQFALPNVAIEALLMVKPVVGAAIGGIPEIVTSRLNGIRTSYPSAPLFTEAILTLLQNDEQRQQFGCQAKKTAEKNFLSKEIYPHLLALYKYVEA